MSLLLLRTKRCNLSISSGGMSTPSRFFAFAQNDTRKIQGRENVIIVITNEELQSQHFLRRHVYTVEILRLRSE